MKKALLIFVVLAVGFGAIFALSRHLERLQTPPDDSIADADLYFSGVSMKTLDASLSGLIADWYWINSLQYLGGKILNNRERVDINDLRPLNPRLLYPMLDRAATLDPQFSAVYSYGAAVLPAIDPQQAIRLLEKGIAANPEQWRLYQNLGYIYWQIKDFERAAQAYETGAQIAGAPAWMRQMSANMRAQGGDRRFALDVYRQMRDSAEDEQTRTFADLRFKQIQSLDERDELQAALTDFQARNNRCARSWRELLPLLAARKNGSRLRVNDRGEAVDPTGVAYVLKPVECAVSLHPDSRIPGN